MRFTDTPELIPLADGNYVVKKPLRYYVGYFNSHVWVDVPEGMKTDGLTLPFWAFFLRWWLPVWGKSGNAVLVHDYLTTHRGWLMVHGRPQRVSRKRADEIFREGLEVLEVSRVKRNLMYFFVRLYGSLQT